VVAAISLADTTYLAFFLGGATV